MNKKTIIMVFGILTLIILIVFSNKKDKSNTNINIVESEEQVDVKYDEETGLYYIRDKETNEIIAASREETDLEFYKKHPDYKLNSDAIRSTDLNDFVEVALPQEFNSVIED